MSKTYVQKLCETRGLKLEDATRPIVVGVAVDDIVKSRTKNSKCCAFARAAQREPGVRAAYFFRSTAFLEFADRMVRYALPSSVQKEIVSFDRAGIMAPGEYQLNAPSPSRSVQPGLRLPAGKRLDKRLERVTARPLTVHGKRAAVSKTTGRTMRRTPFIRTLGEPR